MQKGEVTLSAGCLAFFAFMLTQAWALHSEGRFGEVGSGFWPLLSLGTATILSLVWLVRNVRQYARDKEKAVEAPGPDARAEAWAGRRKVAASLACLLIYMILMPWVGFLVSTLLFIPAFVLGLDERRRSVLIISPFLITGVVLLVFAKFVAIPLPKGVGVFATLSRFFY